MHDLPSGQIDLCIGLPADLLPHATWFGFWAPKGTPKEVVTRLDAATCKALADLAGAAALAGGTQP